MDLIFGIAGAVVGVVVGWMLFRHRGDALPEDGGPEGPDEAETPPDESVEDDDPDRDFEGTHEQRIEALEAENAALQEDLRRATEERDRFLRWIEARFRRLAHELQEQWSEAKLPVRVDELRARNRPPARHRRERIDALAAQLTEWGAELDLSSAEAAHQLGLWHAAQDRLREATDWFHEATVRGMGIEAWLALGECWWELGRRDKAADAYSHCLKNETMPPHAAWRYAEVCAENRQHKEAMAALEPVLGRGDLPTEVLVLACRSASRLGQDERAVEICEDGLKSHPRSVDLLSEMIVPLDRMGDRERAEETAEEARDVDPGAASVPFALGCVHLAHEELGEARKRFEEAVELDGEHAEAHHHLGLVHNRQRRFRKALGALRRAVELKPDYAEAWYAMKDAYEGLKKFEKAIAALEKATKLDPDVA